MNAGIFNIIMQIIEMISHLILPHCIDITCHCAKHVTHLIS